MRAQRWSTGIGLPLHLIAGWRGWLTLSPGRFKPVSDPVLKVQRAWWAPWLVWAGAENLAAIEIRSLDHQTRRKSLNGRTCLRNDVPCIFPGSTAPVGLGLFEVPRQHSFRHTTIRMTHMDEWSARRYLKTQHSQETRHSCPQRDSNPQSPPGSGRRPTL